MFARSPYELPVTHELPQAMLKAAATAGQPIGMSFWTDAAILGDAGIPSVLYGPTGAGLHGVEEWVNVQSVLTCRDALVALAKDWCR
jgi:acetylornithine deacetylase